VCRLVHAHLLLQVGNLLARDRASLAATRRFCAQLSDCCRLLARERLAVGEQLLVLCVPVKLALQQCDLLLILAPHARHLFPHLHIPNINESNYMYVPYMLKKVQVTTENMSAVHCETFVVQVCLHRQQKKKTIAPRQRSCRCESTANCMFILSIFSASNMWLL
jgi:hypothetical protein